MNFAENSTALRPTYSAPNPLAGLKRVEGERREKVRAWKWKEKEQEMR